MSKLTIGSQAHRDLFCGEFMRTHIPYDVAALAWPDLDDASLARLRALPFWDEAVSTERTTAAKVRAQAEREPDPVLREAVALQGYEEDRHSRLLVAMLNRYDIPVPEAYDVSAGTEWNFLRTEYGECFDSFFAFGLFAVAKESGFFPGPLVDRFEPVMQEEARHIIFFINWVAYQRRRLAAWQRPRHVGRCILAMSVQAWSRVQTARGVGGDEFTMQGHASIDADFSAGSFLRLCLAENERRLATYDPRLLRPRLVSSLVKGVCRFLR